MIISFLLIALSAVLLILPFPNFNIEFLAWIAFVPLFFALENQKALRAFLISYLAGCIFFLGTVYWLIHVTLPGMIVAVLYLALYFGFFGLILSYNLSRRRLRFGGTPPSSAGRTTCLAGRPAGRLTAYNSLFFIPALWVSLEWVRSNLFGGFGWVLLAHSQSYNLPVIQIADMTGAYGVSFLVVLVNTAIFLTLKELRDKRYSLGYLMTALFLVFVYLSYGTFRLNNVFTGERMRPAVIQGNIPQAKKWDSSFREDILKKYEALTRKASKERPDLVIWPETSVPGFLESEEDLLSRVSSLARGINSPLLVGTPRQDRAPEAAYYNSAVLFSGTGKIIGRYDKIHLVPFGEFVPFRGALSFVEKFARTPIGDFSSGKDYTVFSCFIERSVNSDGVKMRMVKKAKFSCLICFEDIFPGLTRQFVKNGANFLVNITNDAWFGNTNAAYQHAQCSIFRAIENRTNVVRAANTGLSCFIDQKGQICSSVNDRGRELFANGFKAYDITLTRTRTFYTMYGDIFAYLCMLFGVLNILISGLRRCSRDT